MVAGCGLKNKDPLDAYNGPEGTTLNIENSMKFLLTICATFALVACQNPTAPEAAKAPNVVELCFAPAQYSAKLNGFALDLLWTNDVKNTMVLETAKSSAVPYQRWLVEVIKQTDKDIADIKPWSCKSTSIDPNIPFYNF